MPESAVSAGRDRAALARPAATGPHTGEVPRPQWQGLFREPELPPYDEEDEV